MSVKVLILAAGRGERLRPLTDRLAKPAIPFLNRPLIHYALDHAAALGMAPVGINLHHLPHTVKAAVADWDGPGLDLHWSPENELMGTGGALEGFRDWSAQAAVLLCNGDTLCDFDPRALLAAQKDSGAAAALLTRANPDPAAISTVIVGEGRVRQIAGLPRTAVPAGEVRMFAGRHALAPGFIARHATPHPGDICHDLYPPLIARREFPAALDMTSPVWADLGTRERWLAATGAALRALEAGQWPLPVAKRSRLIHHPAGGRLLLDERAKARWEKFRVEGWAVIGADCFVGEDALLRECVLLPGARVGRGARVERSLVAPGALVAAGADCVEKLLA